MQFESLTLANTITGIRSSDPCQLPWIATQYCYVDFNKQWEMANSVKRQVRCSNMASNAAVFIESILRNTNMEAFMQCWGDAIQAALLDEIQEELVGRKWIASLGITFSVDQELLYWKSKGITNYSVQWQNYKLLGVAETVLVQTALGISYPLTLKKSTGAYRFLLQTSMKMYWGWGSDLLAISQNTTYMGHKSLLLKSAKFAFQNQSIESSLSQNKTLTFPLDDGLTLVRQTLGPFGSIDLIHVPCPLELAHLYKTFSDEDTNTLLNSANAQAPVTGTAQVLTPIPPLWMQKYAISRGGNILCPRLAASVAVPGSMLLWYSQFSSCDGVFSEAITITRQHTTMALISWGAFEPCISNRYCIKIPEMCNKTVYTSTNCLEFIEPVYEWIIQYMDEKTVRSYYQLAKLVQEQIDVMNIEIVQYVQIDVMSPVELVRLNIFHDEHFSMIAWYLLIDWVNGIREVVSIQGDAGQMNVISSYSQMLVTTPNPLEVPTNLTYYAQQCIQYTTLVIFLVTFIAILFTFLNRGHIEGLNMLKINRVAGIVWVGRPLLFLRSIAAIVLLSTAVVKLEVHGIFTRIAPYENSSTQHLSTVLAGFETCWLVIVVTDVCMAATRDYTGKYSFYSSLLATIITVILSYVIPVSPSFTISRECYTNQIDFQLTCTAGTIEIGSIKRLLLLSISTVAIIIACYYWAKWWHPNYRLPQHKLSLLLPAGAHYLYNKGPWIFDNILYLDKASAFMCGLIAFTINRSIYILDIKTWRGHTISIDDDFTPIQLSKDVYDQKRISAVVPLLD